MKVIYSLCSWGLGHATRSLPIIRRLLKENHELTIISHDRSLQLLEKELENTVSYIDIPDYPLLISENSRQFIAKSMIYWPLFIKRIQSGLSQLSKILEKQHCDCIISDGRYDMYSRHIPSFFISHQIRILNPLRIKMLETGSETFNEFFFKRFNEIIIPDYQIDGFSGKLSHDLKKIDEKKLHYVGVLSDFNKKKMKKDIDYFISLSGPEPQRSILEEKILSQIDNLDGSIVMTLGKTEEQNKTQSDSIKTYSYLSKEKREELLNRSKMVISRSGYSTILDLSVIGCKALMIPTPGQIEQEYLAEYHKQKNTCYTVNQDLLNLKKDIVHTEKTTGFKAKRTVDDAVENVMQIISYSV
ncbi:glycosyltransferase [Thermoplasmatales archaeon ex4572_165]|nr:MAG: glycosyltransferase [Thermoplasmatales archaeon ex4572_165]RLF59735.1 MAG: glycosyltransferase [Thermoplasmata archaeon]